MSTSLTAESLPFLEKDYHSTLGRRYTPQRTTLLSHCLLIIFTALLTWWITSTFSVRRHCSPCSSQVGSSTTYIGDSGDLPLDADSPFGHIDRAYRTQWFQPWNFTPTPWNEHPSHGRVDALWKEELGIGNQFMLIPIDEGAQYGLDERVNVVLRDVEGQQDGFPVVIEALHQLHCLDALRRKLFMNHEWYVQNWKHMSTHSMELAHTSHCLDMIRQVIMCKADVGVTPWIWVKTKANALPEFHRPHRCHNFTAVRDFSARMQMPRSIDSYLANQAPPPDVQYLDVDMFG